MQRKMNKVMRDNEQDGPKENTGNPYTCQEYREEMVLVGLRQRLAKPGLTDKERAVLEQEIARVEKELGF